MTPPEALTEAPAATTVAERVVASMERVDAACRLAGRAPGSVSIVAVAKGVAPEAVARAVAAGIRQVGENRVADGAARRERVMALLGPDGPTWQLIGALQSNKARLAVATFDRIDSVGSVRLAERLAVLARERGARLPILLQVALSDAPGRNGLAPDAVLAAGRALAALPDLLPRGLMAVAPLGVTPAATRAAFERVAGLRAQLAEDPEAPGDWPVLSLGMSSDFELAIAAGATEVRLGTALFGPRAVAPDQGA